MSLVVAIATALGIVVSALAVWDRRTRVKVDVWRSFVCVPGLSEAVPEWWGLTVANVGSRPIQIVAWEVRLGRQILPRAGHVGRPPSVGDLVATVGVLGEGDLSDLPVTIPPGEQRHFGSIGHQTLAAVIRPYLALGVDIAPTGWVSTGAGRRVRGPELPPHRPIIRSRWKRWWRGVGPGALPGGGFAIAPERLKTIELERVGNPPEHLSPR